MLQMMKIKPENKLAWFNKANKNKIIMIMVKSIKELEKIKKTLTYYKNLFSKNRIATMITIILSVLKTSNIKLMINKGLTIWLTI